jgi:hypothetical protein
MYFTGGMRKGLYSVKNKPWLPYIVTDYIKWLKPRTVFEWGGGGSTLFFLSLQSTREFISIEDNPEWYNRVSGKLKHYNASLERRLILPDPSEIGPDPANPLHYKSGSTELGAVNFKRYASVIDDYGLFDLILIDGIARASCLYHAFSHVAPGGCIVLDNTGDRPYYLEQTEQLFGNYESGWEKITMMGYGPILDYKWETTIFINKVKGDYGEKL